MEFIEAPVFTRYLSKYLNDDEFRKLQTRLGANPEVGDLMPGTGGFRKMRWADARRGKKEGEAGCGLSTTTFHPISKFGS